MPNKKLFGPIVAPYELIKNTDTAIHHLHIYETNPHVNYMYITWVTLLQTITFYNMSTQVRISSDFHSSTLALITNYNKNMLVHIHDRYN